MSIEFVPVTWVYRDIWVISLNLDGSYVVSVGNCDGSNEILCYQTLELIPDDGETCPLESTFPSFESIKTAISVFETRETVDFLYTINYIRSLVR